MVLQKLMTQKISVKPRIVGKPAPGYEIASVEVNNPQVEIAGPEEVVKNLESLYTKPIEIQG